ncbi:MAG TPA: hypothetical protein VE955_11305 [Candidatus Dormibacteraeota bacterium]|nr:hypothetical protein [Candidatus Dormibacteraeota bacterium]
MQRKGPKAPFALITLILLFGKKKPAKETQPTASLQEKIQPFPIPDSLRKSITGGDVSKARDRLRLASLERDIIGDALTKIYEAETKGLINETEKNQILQRYKTDLKRVDGEIDTYKKTVDLFELESAKEELLKSFHEKMLEIDLKISQIKPSVSISSEDKVAEVPNPPKTDAQPAPSQPTPAKEKPAREKPRNKAEERLETIREEVLKAMERLEQIETEG